MEPVAGATGHGAIPGSELDDARLIRLLRGCAAGTMADLEKLYQLVAPRLLGQLVRLLGDRAQAEDGLQEVFIKVWDKSGSFDPSRGRAMAWLMSVARNHAIDQMRARRHSVPLDENSLELIVSEPTWSADESGLTSATLERCFGQLTAEQRQCVRLAYVAGHSQEQIAGLLKSPLGTVKSWIRRALLSLRECMGT